MAKPLIATDEDFPRVVLRGDLPVLVDFWAAWCGPCRQIAPLIDQLAEELDGKIKVVKVNVDQANFTQNRYGIFSIPTLGVFWEGELVRSAVGVQPKKEIYKLLEPFLPKDD